MPVSASLPNYDTMKQWTLCTQILAAAFFCLSHWVVHGPAEPFAATQSSSKASCSGLLLLKTIMEAASTMKMYYY